MLTLIYTLILYSSPSLMNTILKCYPMLLYFLFLPYLGLFTIGYRIPGKKHLKVTQIPMVTSLRVGQTQDEDRDR